jgi:hypothetical protein
MRKLKSYSEFIQVKENASFDLLKFDAFTNELDLEQTENEQVVDDSKSES